MLYRKLLQFDGSGCIGQETEEAEFDRHNVYDLCVLGRGYYTMEDMRLIVH